MGKSKFDAFLAADMDKKKETREQAYQETISEQGAEVERLKQELAQAQQKMQEAESRALRLEEETNLKDDMLQKLESQVGSGAISKTKSYSEFASGSIKDEDIDKRNLAIAKKIFFSLFGDIDNVRKVQRVTPKIKRDEDGFPVFDDRSGKPILKDDLTYSKFSILIPDNLLKEIKNFSQTQCSMNIGLYMIITTIKDMYTNPLYEEYRKSHPFFQNKDEVLASAYKFLGESFFD